MQKCTNRFLYRCEMKRVFSCILCLSFLLNLASCSEVSDKIQKNSIVAVEYASANEKAFEEYITQDFTKVTYNSSSDVVLAVENGKAEYGILNTFEFNLYKSAQRKIKIKETCEYRNDYCAYFSLENDSLQKSFNEAIRKLKKDGTLQRIKYAHYNNISFSGSKPDNENGVLTMLCDPSFEGRVYTDEKGDVVGLDVDIVRELCNAMGYNLKYR